MPPDDDDDDEGSKTTRGKKVGGWANYQGADNKYMTGHHHLLQHTQQQWLSDSARHFPSLHQLYIYILSLSSYYVYSLCIILPKYTSLPFSFYFDMVTLGGKAK